MLGRVVGLCALLWLAQGCGLHMSQVTENRPIRAAAYEAVKLGEQGRRQVLAELGPPDSVAYTATEVVFDYASGIHRGTDVRVFVPSEVLPVFDPSALLALPRFFFDPWTEAEVFEPSMAERAASAAVSTVPFAAGGDVLRLHGRQLRWDRLRVVFDRRDQRALRKSLWLTTGEYAEESLLGRALLRSD